jgi:two-component system nitrogen regulation response regulator NtrX
MSTVLIVDDEIDIQSALSFALKDEGYNVFTASSPAEAEAILAEKPVDLGLFDVWFPEGDGIELLKTSRARYPHAVVIMMSGHGNIELALNSIRLGAYDFLEKPLELEKVLVTLRNAAETQALRNLNQSLIHQIVGRPELLGSSPGVTALRDSVGRAAGATSHVLVTGENGTGKGLVARLLHQASPRRDRPFVTFSCAQVAEARVEQELFGSELGGSGERAIGRFEHAGAGTLFLDEIGELSLAAQAKLLRVLEDRSYERVGGAVPLRAEARVVASSTKDLPQLVKDGRFREDLFFRLNVISLPVPALRERREDIPELAREFLASLARDNLRAPPRLAGELLAWMQRYDWPGNVRELRNLIERMLIMSHEADALDLADLPEELQSPAVPLPTLNLSSMNDLAGSLRELRAQFERLLIEQRLGKLSGNVTKTAESLGIERAHLHRKLRQYGIRATDAV